MSRNTEKYKVTAKSRPRRKYKQLVQQKTSNQLKTKVQTIQTLPRAKQEYLTRAKSQTLAKSQALIEQPAPKEHLAISKLSLRNGRQIAWRLIAICIAPIAVCVNFTNYGPLIPVLQNELHINSGQIGLFSTLLFLGIALTNIPGGLLADLFGSRLTMLGSLILVSAGSLLFPLIPNFTWMVVCRAMIGLGAGAALVAGSHATSELGRYEALGQGLNGGVAQLGAGLGLFVTPQLLGPLGWQGALFVSGGLGILAFVVWLFVPSNKSDHIGEARQQANPVTGIRSPAIWALGLSNMGTFGLGNAITAWLAIYFTTKYNLPLVLAAGFGSIGLFAGIVFRPLGGLLLARTRQPLHFIRAGTIMAFLGLGVLALPIASLPLACIGLLLLALGTTLPYAAIFSTASAIGKTSPIGSGVAQGLIAILASPVAIAGPPIIGLLLEEQKNNFTLAFGVIAATFSIIAVIASMQLKAPNRRIKHSKLLMPRYQ